MKPLKRIKKNLYSYRNGKIIEGIHSDLSGNCSDFSGNCTGLKGNCTGLSGNCSEISVEDRIKHPEIDCWVEKEAT